MSNSSFNNVVHADYQDPRRWFALVVIGIATLMVVLDSSIVNVALPHAALSRKLQCRIPLSIMLFTLILKIQDGGSHLS